MNIFITRLKKNILLFFVIIVLTTLWCIQLFAKPVSLEASDGLDTLKIIVVEKQINNNNTHKFLTTLRDTNSSTDSKIIAILALSYAQDSDSLKLLEETSNIADNESISGAAQYATFIRYVYNLSDIDRQNALFYYFGHSRNMTARLFTGNRIAIDYKEKVFIPLLICAKHETSKVIQCDLLYYLSKTNIKSNLELIIKEKWDDNIAIPENLRVILSAITPGRDKEKFRTDYSGVIIDTIKNRIINSHDKNIQK
jgi:hypothetical protein